MIKKFSLILLLIITAQLGYSQSNLSFKLNAGDEFTMLQKAKQTITQEIPGGSQVIVNNLNGGLHFKVKEVTKEVIIMDMTYTNFSMVMSSPQLGEMMNINTEDENASSMESTMFKGLLNKPNTLLMEPTGKIREVKNGMAIINGMIEAMGVEDPAVAEQIKAQLGNDWSGETLASSFEQMTYNYPSSNVKSGDSWKTSFKGEGKIQAENTWTLNTITGETAQISGAATVVMKTSNPQVTMNLSGTQNTTIVSDMNSGLITTMEVKGIAKGETTIAAMPGTTIPTTIESVTTYTRQ